MFQTHIYITIFQIYKNSLSNCKAALAYFIDLFINRSEKRSQLPKPYQNSPSIINLF